MDTKELSIHTLIQAVREFYNSPDSPNVILEQAKKAYELLNKNFSGVQAGFLLGFPSYIGAEKLEEPIQEINRHISEQEYLVNGSKPYPCFECYHYGNLTDPRSLCQPCDKSPLKPRKLQGLMPDIDLLVVIKDTTIQEKIINLLEMNGYIPSDYDIGASCDQVIAATKKKRVPFPIDLHLTTTEEIILWAGNFNCNDPNSWKLAISSWYGTNLNPEQRHIGIGTVSTMIELGSTNDLSSLIQGVTEKIKKHFASPEDLLAAITKGSQQIARMASQNYIRARLLRRISQNIYPK